MTSLTKFNLDELFSILLGTVAPYVGGLSMYSMSRVCKRWHAVVNEVLWRHLPNLLPLLQLLPQDMEANFSTCNSPNAVRSLARFKELAAHVHSINWSEEEHEQLQSFDRWLLLLHRSQPMGDLLPNLRTLFANCATASGARALVPWISPSLINVEISITVTGEDTAGTSILSALERCSTNITSFSLKINHQTLRRQPMLHQALLSVLQRMKRLRVVTIPLYASPGPHMDVLGAMQDLEELTLHLMEPPRGYASFDEAAHFTESSVVANAQRDDYLDSLDEFDDLLALPETSPLLTVHAVTQPFPRLHTLHVLGPFAHVADMLTYDFHQLKQLNLTVPSVRSENDMEEVMDIIANKYPSLNLVTTHIVSRANLRWIDTRPLGEIPHAILADYTMFHSIGLIPAMEAAERAVGRQYYLA